jgi:uncharacterized protein YbjT (DUF2867 family)
MKIAIVGGSGLVGSHLLDLLGQSATHEVHAILRRTVADRPKLTQHVAQTAAWPATIAALQPDIFVATLGTTIGQAGSQAAFAAIDKTLLLDCASASGARQAIVVSSVGAGGSGFYLKTKGEAEAGLKALSFDRLDILRPGLLLGQRSGPARRAERLGMTLAPLTNLLTPRRLDRYRAIEAADVAAAIATLIDAQPDGLFIHHNREMLALAD